MDDYISNSANLANPWSSDDNFCGGVESAAGDNNVWKDVTTAGTGNVSDCATTPSNCAMRDKISGLIWTKIQSANMSWGTAMNNCKNLSFNDFTSGWRLPTQKELMDTYNHGILSSANDNWIPSADMKNLSFWSSSSSYGVNRAWTVHLAYAIISEIAKGNTKGVACVR